MRQTVSHLVGINSCAAGQVNIRKDEHGHFRQQRQYLAHGEWNLKKRRKSGFGTRSATEAGWRAALAGLAALLALWPAPAGADLQWDIPDPDISIGDFDAGHAGLESLYAFTIQNLSTPGDANNLISFTLTAPSDMQLFYIEPPDGWSYDNAGASVSFNGNYIPPGNQLTLNIYSYFTSTSLGTANATSRGETEPTPFPQLNNITLPSASIPEPTTLSLILAGAGAYLLGRRKPRPGNQEETAPRKQGGSLPAA